MGGRVVPFGVGLSLANEQAVAHVEWNNHALALVGADGPLADRHVVEVDEVVDGRDAVQFHDAEGVEDLPDDDLAVPIGVRLGEGHVEHVSDGIVPSQELEPFRDGRLPVTLFLEGLELLSPGAAHELGLDLGDLLLVWQLESRMNPFRGDALPVVGDAEAQVTGPRMDRNPCVPVVVPADLDEMVAAAQGSDAMQRPGDVGPDATADFQELVLPGGRPARG